MGAQLLKHVGWRPDRDVPESVNIAKFLPPTSQFSSRLVTGSVSVTGWVTVPDMEMFDTLHEQRLRKLVITFPSSNNGGVGYSCASLKQPCQIAAHCWVVALEAQNEQIPQ